MEYRHINGEWDVMHFVKDNHGKIMVLTPKSIKPIQLSKHKRKEKQLQFNFAHAIKNKL